jgi:hypothetical protein
MLVAAFDLEDPNTELRIESYAKNVDRFKKINEEVALNQIVEYDQEVTVRHPLTIITEALSKTLCNIRQDSSIITFNSLARTLDFSYESVVPRSGLWTCVKQQACELTKSDIFATLITKEEKLAFFINMYNMIFLHSMLLMNGSPTSTLHNQMFLRASKYNVFGMEFSLQSITNGVLGGNKPHWFYGKSFTKSDPRHLFALELTTEEQQLVYFALANFKSDSPRVEVLYPERVMKQLLDLKKEYLHTHVQIDNDSNSVQVPLYFKEIVTSAGISKASRSGIRKVHCSVLAGEFALDGMEQLGLLSPSELEKHHEKEYSFCFTEQDIEQSTDIRCLFESQKVDEAIISLQRTKRLAKKKQTRAQAMERIKIVPQMTDQSKIEQLDGIRFHKTHFCTFQ